MTDIYLQGIAELLQQMDLQSQEYITVSTLQMRLARVLQSERVHGATPDTRSEFTQIIEELNRISVTLINRPFSDLCRINDDANSNRDKQSSTSIEKRFFSGALLYISIIDFPALSTKNQGDALSFIEKEIENFVKAVGATYWVNSRGADCILFIERNYDEHKSLGLTKLLLLAIKLQTDSYNRPYKIGNVLHWEDNAIWRHLMSAQYLIGPAINESVRILLYSRTNHLILSSRVHDLLSEFLNCGGFQGLGSLLAVIKENGGPNVPYINLFESSSVNINNLLYKCEEIDAYDKYIRSHTIYNFFISDHSESVIVGNSVIPGERVLVDYDDTVGDNYIVDKEI